MTEADAVVQAVNAHPMMSPWESTALEGLPHSVPVSTEPIDSLRDRVRFQCDDGSEYAVEYAVRVRTQRRRGSPIPDWVHEFSEVRAFLVSPVQTREEMRGKYANLEGFAS